MARVSGKRASEAAPKPAKRSRRTSAPKVEESDDEGEWAFEGEPVTKKNGLTFYESARYTPPSVGGGVRGSKGFTVAFGDVVLSQVDLDDESTKLCKLAFWVAQVAALYETKSGEKKFVMRYFEVPRFLEAKKRTPDAKFRDFELIETDDWFEMPLSIIVKKVEWQEEYEEAALNEEDEQGLPDIIYSERILYRYEAGGKNKKPMTGREELWSVPADERRQRLFQIHEYARLYANAAIAPVSAGPDAASAYDRATHQLQLSVPLDNLVGREDERKKIAEFLNFFLKSTDKGSSLYIAGMPGTGKTATVTAVVEEFKRKRRVADTAIPEFTFVKINAMKLSAQGELFTTLCSELQLKRTPGQQAADRLNKFFTSGAKTGKVLLLLDEIDALVPKKTEASRQELLYQLFEWTTRASLAVIAISNTMDLPDRLSERVKSRMGSARLVFMPYSRDQIRKMVEARMHDAKADEVFSGDALGMLSVKVAQMSGDARKAMQIMAHAIEEKKKTGGKVNAGDIHNACLAKFKNFYREAVVALPTSLVRVVLGLWLELGREKTFVVLRDVWKRFKAFAEYQLGNHFRAVTFERFQGMVEKLKDCGLVEVRAVTTKREDQADGETGDHLMTHDGKKVSKKTTADDNDDDEDGAMTLIGFSGMFDINDVGSALKEVADAAVKRFLTE